MPLEKSLLAVLLSLLRDSPKLNLILVKKQENYVVSEDHMTKHAALVYQKYLAGKPA